MTYEVVVPHKRALAFELFLALFAISIPVSVYAGFFPFLSSSTENISVIEEVIPTGSVLDAPVLSAVNNIDPNIARGGAEIIIYEGAIVSSGPVGEDQIAEARKEQMGEINVYVVREGDSLSQIAEMFGVTSNTILWANDLPRATSIRPGDTLVILPIAGVRHVVKSGDTIATIAKKYEADVEEILSYNQLASASEISTGMTVIVPGGKVPAPVVAKASAAAGGNKSGSFLSHPVPGAVKTQGIHGYNAVDLAGSIGMGIRAAASGEVIVSKSSGWNGGYGNYIVIRHSNGAQTLYAHLSRNDVGVGASVTAGQTIGAMGNTGRSTGPHLHFEVRGARNPF